MRAEGNEVEPPPTSDPLIPRSVAALAALVQRGDWYALGVALLQPGDDTLGDGDRQLLFLMATGASLCLPASLPSYALARAVGRRSPAAERLCALAAGADQDQE